MTVNSDTNKNSSIINLMDVLIDNSHELKCSTHSIISLRVLNNHVNDRSNRNTSLREIN